MKIKLFFYATLIMISLAFQLQAQTNLNTNKNIEAEIEQRVEVLLSKMTLAEKIAQVCAVPVRQATAIEEGFY